MVVTSNEIDNEDMQVKAKSGGCPIDHTKTSMNPSSWFRWPSSSSKNTKIEKNSTSGGGGCPVKHDSRSECPVKHDSTKKSLPFAIPPASLEQAANYAQAPQPDQQIPLSTYRVVSSIPRGDTKKINDNEEQSSHSVEEENSTKWMYPSEQQFYNALRRKGWEGVEETNMPLVVRIHNAVNEKGWSHIRRWESLCHSNASPKLVKFMGRPKDLSPRAFLNTYLLGYHPPFDRHDWYVEQEGSTPRRYVIDFYSGKEDVRQHQHNRPPSMYLDVRPALDSPRDALDRIQMFFIDALPGIYNAISRPASSNNNWDTTTTMSPQRPKNNEPQSPSR